VRIRGHNLLCIQGFVGKGYNPEFIENMTRVVGSLVDDARVTVIDQPDVLCTACPNLAESGCVLQGEGSEQAMVRQDRDVMGRLGVTAGETLSWSAIVSRIAERVVPDDLDDICGQCPWLPLGVCKVGIERLSR